MAASLRVVGTWAELTADGAVTIPSTPQAGDRMFLFATWKDYAITATVSGWTAVGSEYADGTVTAANNVGSMKVQCWYRDWQEGDGNPTVDFSSSPNIAGVVITVWQKTDSEVWTTPLIANAALSWSTSQTTTSAGSTTAVKGGAVVLALCGIRDDSAAFTRATTGIDVSSGITWNGDYVESPSTHLTTGTGFDCSADLGYRLVTTGGTVTLRTTGTLSATETGAALWVTQATNILVTPTTLALTTAAFAPKLALSVIPPTRALTLATFAPKFGTGVVPPTRALTLATFAPTVTAGALTMTLSNAAETALLSLLFENANWANVGDATGLRGSSTAGSFYVSLHTASPGEAGTQSTSEISYTGYARVAVARSTAGFTVTNDTVSNDAAIIFGLCTAGSGTATHFAIGTDSSGAGNLLLFGTLTASLAVSTGVTPVFGVGALTATAA